MSEFGEMIKEAFMGDEPFEPNPGRDALDGSVRKFEKRMRTVRFMTWFAVTFMSVVAIIMMVLLLRADDDTSVRTMLVYASVFIWAAAGIGLSKGWFAMMHNHFGVMKELKRVQIMLLERKEP